MEYIGSEEEEEKTTTPPISALEQAFPGDQPSQTRDLTFDIGVAGPFAPRQYLGR
jgi:hypothetical protein